MSEDDLVKRLQAVDHDSVEDCFRQSPLYEYAADRIETLEEMLDTAAYLLTESMVQLREGKIKTRRNRADIIEQVLKEWRSK